MQDSFRFVALPLETFAPLFAQDDAALAQKGIRRMVAEARPGFPCRVSLTDAEPGERVLLVPFEHHPVATPYRASGPIFVRETAVRACPAAGEVPDVVRHRLLSVRAYDAEGMMLTAEVSEGRVLETLIARLFAWEAVAYLHLHNAGPGCFACRVDRA